MLKQFYRKLALIVVPFLGSLIIKFIYYTSKKNFHLPSNVPEEPIINAFWHGDLLLQPYIYNQLRAKPHAKVVISEHFDGLLIAKTMEYFKLGTVHGSTTRSSVKVLMQAIRVLKEGYDIGITPDGPKGPRHEVQDGVIVMAQKTKSKVLVYSCVPSRYWQLGSWDRFTIPKPFSTLELYASEPLDIADLPLEEARTLIKNALMEHHLDAKA